MLEAQTQESAVMREHQEKVVIHEFGYKTEDRESIRPFIGQVRIFAR